MSQFKKNLEALPSIDHIASLEIVENPAIVIENKPGKSGSLKVYNYLNEEFGALTVEAAKRGLVLFGEHTEEARHKPGSHPNIDFLFKVVDGDATLQMKINKI